MPTIPNPFDYMRLGFDMTRLGIETHSVIALRMLGMAGVWDTPFDENYRMVAEKHGAFLLAGSAVIDGARQGQHPLSLARAAMEPLDQATSQNRQRLSERGLRKPGI